jgi:simple sugar transport system ATP-binding protein
MPDEHLLVEMKNISKTYAGVRALQEISLTIKHGEVHCLVGENGSGKSTLIKILSGAIYPDRNATIDLCGKSYTKLRTIDSINEGIEVIYQDLSLFPELSVKENIAVSETIKRRRALINWKRVTMTAKDALDHLCVSLDLDDIVGHLSRAQQQLVAIARALVSDAKLIVMDEPTSSLSKAEIDSLLHIVDKLRTDKISTLFVSHKLDEVLAISDRITILRDGKSVGVFLRNSLSIEKITTLMTGKSIEEHRSITDNCTTNILDVSGLTRGKDYHDISFYLRKGEILGIIGLLGSGRTEAMLSLFGMTKPDSGEIFLDGKRISVRSPNDAIRKGISYLPEDRLTEGLFLKKSVIENIVTSKLNKKSLQNTLVRKKMNQQVADQWIRLLRIKTPSMWETVQKLSGGNQQRVVLAKCLATNPKVLILDGPTIGVDINAKENIQDLIKEISKQGLGIILVSDEINEVVKNCNRILIMKKGTIEKEYNSIEHNQADLMGLIAAQLT